MRPSIHTAPSRRDLLSAAAIATMLVASSSVPASTPAAAASLSDTFAPSSKGSTVVADHAVWDRHLKRFVTPGADGLNRVAYGKWKAEGHAELKSYVASLEKIDPATLDRAEQFAFWANLYNAKTIDIVLDKYPVKSIKDISLGGGLKALVTGGPWQAKVVRVKGQQLSLDDIEHQIMRQIFKDPRVHYSVNCASVGCPNLANEAFTGAKLEQQLEAGAKAFVNHPRGLRIENGKLKASSIYTWFVADFGGSEAGVLAHVRKYAAPALAKQLESITSIADYDYDWTLNDLPG